MANHTTNSAAAIFTTLLQDNNLATVIGTSVANNATGATGYYPFELPNTKFKGSVASDYIIRPKSSKGKVQMPDYWIENRVEDLISGKDKLLKKALKLINDK